MYGDDGRYGLTDDEKAAGLGELLQGRYDTSSYSNVTSGGGKKPQGFPKNHGAKWTDTEIEEVKYLFKSGSSVSEIAIIKERSAYAVAWRLYDLKLITLRQREAIKSQNIQVYYSEQKRPIQKINSIQVPNSPLTQSSVKRIDKLTNTRADIPRSEHIIDSKFFNVIKTHVESFFTIWVVVIFLNQLLIFNACFAPYCIIAALPHTGVIAAVLTYINKK